MAIGSIAVRPEGDLPPISPPFRVYIVFALLVCFPMLMVWFNSPHDLSTFTPAWAFLVSRAPALYCKVLIDSFRGAPADLDLPDGAWPLRSPPMVLGARAEVCDHRCSSESSPSTSST